MPASRQSFEKVVGVVGGAGSGKDTVANIFQQNRFTHISSSDLVREEIARRGLTTSRELQTKIANEQREKHGIGYWVDLALDQIEQPTARVAVSGLYAPGEGVHLMDEYSGTLVGVAAGAGDDSALRFDRIKSRSSGDRDRLDFEEFMVAHERENSGVLDHETNIARLMTMARFVIYNVADLDELERQTLAVIDEVMKG